MKILQKNVCRLKCNCGWNVLVGGGRKSELKRLIDFIKGRPTLEELKKIRQEEKERIKAEIGKWAKKYQEKLVYKDILKNLNSYLQSLK